MKKLLGLLCLPLIASCSFTFDNSVSDEPHDADFVAQTWATAVEQNDGKKACSQVTPALAKELINRAGGQGKTCAEAFEFMYAGTSKENRRIDAINLIEDENASEQYKKPTRYYELQWANGEEGDGAGIELVKTSEGWLVRKA